MEPNRGKEKWSSILNRGSVTGVDMNEEAIREARTTAEKSGLRNVEFRVGDCYSYLKALRVVNDFFHKFLQTYRKAYIVLIRPFILDRFRRTHIFAV
jgi:hypothetical protein